MRILLMLGEQAALVEALSRRGHRVTTAAPTAALTPNDELTASDLVVVPAELADRTDVIARVSTESPGIAFVLVGRSQGKPHPDVIEQLDLPAGFDRLLAVVDELADILDGERLREPIELVAYETLFAGDSPQIRELLRRVRLVARSDAAVWIFGDDGSGRAIIARAIHDRSTRRARPYVAFNTAAHADDDLAQRLFGAGGAIVQAAGGTLFLERAGQAGPHTQRALNNYLETDRSGDSPRLVFGIQRDGGALHVSSDLYYRLKVLEVEIPPLRERARDLEHIVGRMLERLAGDGKAPEVTDDTMSLLERYAFPGNLLELAHALTHAFVLARGTAIEPEHLPVSIRQGVGRPPPNGDIELEALDTVAKRFERDYLLRVLRAVGGNRGRAAEILGLSRKGLWGKLKSHDISDAEIDAPT